MKVIKIFYILLSLVFISGIYYKYFYHSNKNAITFSSTKLVNYSSLKLNTSLHQFINVVKLTPKKHNFRKATLKYLKPLTIYVYDENDMISNSILAYGVWESWLVNEFSQYILSNPGIQVLDAGCNIGVYTLVAAALGVKVVSVDANQNNTDRLSQAVIENGFSNSVKICLNAITNTRKEFLMTKSKNIGSQNILEDSKSPKRVKAVFIDDLIPFFDKERDVMIKIDIEGREIETFKKAERFFSERNVKLVQMEWEWIKKMADIKYLLDFFTKRNYKCFENFKQTRMLNLNNYLSWPMDVVWIKM